MMDDRRTGEDRRGLGRPKGGRRSTEPIINLEHHATPFVTVSQLCDYWCYHRNTLLEWIEKGRLPAMGGPGEYRIRTSDALMLERELFKKRTLR